ncbi:hypothetical protein EW146_g6667, partial [Bondarzewia mesenterica]
MASTAFEVRSTQVLYEERTREWTTHRDPLVIPPAPAPSKWAAAAAGSGGKERKEKEKQHGPTTPDDKRPAGATWRESPVPDRLSAQRPFCHRHPLQSHKDSLPLTVGRSGRALRSLRDGMTAEVNVEGASLLDRVLREAPRSFERRPRGPYILELDHADERFWRGGSEGKTDALRESRACGKNGTVEIKNSKGLGFGFGSRPWNLKEASSSTVRWHFRAFWEGGDGSALSAQPESGPGLGWGGDQRAMRGGTRRLRTVAIAPWWIFHRVRISSLSFAVGGGVGMRRSGVEKEGGAGGTDEDWVVWGGRQRKWGWSGRRWEGGHDGEGGFERVLGGGDSGLEENDGDGEGEGVTIMIAQGSGGRGPRQGEYGNWMALEWRASPAWAMEPGRRTRLAVRPLALRESREPERCSSERRRRDSGAGEICVCVGSSPLSLLHVHHTPLMAATSQPIAFPSNSIDATMASGSFSGNNGSFNPASYTRAFFGSPISWRPGSFGSRFYPGSSPGQLLGPLDPTDFRCGKISSSIESDRGSLLHALSTMEREDELCRNYTCCGLNLTDLHALVDHFEECHVVVVDPYAASGSVLAPPGTTLKNPSYFPADPMSMHQHAQQHLGSFDPDDMELDLDSSPSSSSASSPPQTPVTTPLPYSSYASSFASLSQPNSACPSPVSAFDTTAVMPSRGSPLASFPPTHRGVSARAEEAFNGYSAYSDYSAGMPGTVPAGLAGHAVAEDNGSSEPGSPFGCLPPRVALQRQHDPTTPR